MSITFEKLKARLWSIPRSRPSMKRSRQSSRLLARPKRFELLTPRFVVWCSIQLSYGRGGPLATGFAR